jgi:hypothetical protein
MPSLDIRLPKIVSLTSTITFDNPVTFIPVRTITGPLTITKDTTNAQQGFGAIHRVIANGSNVPDLSAFKKIGSGDYVNTNGVVNQFWFVYDGYDYCVSITQPVAIGGGGGGLTQLPTVSSFTATAFSDTQINLTWTDEANESSYDIYVNTSNTFGGASLLINKAANSTSHSHTGLTAGTQYYYWIIAKGDGVTYSDSNTSTTNTTTTGGGGVASPLIFDTVIFESSTITETATTTSTGDPDYNHYGVSSQTIDAGDKGRVTIKVENASADTNCYFFVRSVGTTGAISDVESICGFSIEPSGQCSPYSNGANDGSNIDMSAEIATGFMLALERTDEVAGTWKLRSSTNGGTSWTDRHTFTNTNTGTVYPANRLYATGRINAPRIELL